MKNIKITKFLIISILSVSIHATDYDNAKFDNFVSGQGVNEVLAEAQFIICSMAKMGTKELSGDGTYKATLYSDECEQAGAASTDSSQGTTAPSSASSSSSSSTAATAGSDNTAREIDTVIVNTGFTTPTMQTTKAWLLNDKPYDERSNPEPKNITYLLGEQTAPASDTNKYGDFTLRYQRATAFGNTNEELPEWYSCPDPTSNDYQYSWCSDGAPLGQGILIAQGGSIKFKSDIHNSPQQNVVADYLSNGDIAGIYSRSAGFRDESLYDPTCDEQAYDSNGNWDGDAFWNCQPQAYRDSEVQILGIFAFGISDTSKSYCTKMSELYSVDWTQYDETIGGPPLTPYTLSETGKRYLGESNSWDTEEKCFSIDRADAIQNIWDYGVYNSDGSSYATTNQSFPIRSTVTVGDSSRRVHGYASYWGVWVDDEYQQYITDATEWVRDDDTADSENQAKFKLKVKTIEIDKREKSFMALNDLDSTSFRFWVNDSYWSDEYQKLGFPKVEPYEGKIQFKSSKATFTDYNNGLASEPLTYGLYGYHDGANTFIADLTGAKIDKDNLRKMIKNDASDPGKPMNLTMEFNEFPTYENQAYEFDDWVRIYLCNSHFEPPTAADVYDFSKLGISTGLCLSVEGRVKASSASNGNELTLSSDPNEQYYFARFKDFESNLELMLPDNLLNQGGNTYDFKISLNGIERPAGMELKLQNLFTRFGSLAQGDNDGGDIQRGLESFLDSSDSFTFLISGSTNLYDHEGNRFRKVMGRFKVSDTPPATVFVDDVKVNEPLGTGSTPITHSITLSSAQSSAVSFDYAISAASTADANDYSSLTAGTVTIAAGDTTASISYNVLADGIAEGQTDEKIILSLSNPTNAVLGRSTATTYIYDQDTNRVVYEDYYGSYDAASNTFSITEGLKYNPDYVREDLPAPITFTTTEWITHMKKIWGEGEDWEFTDYRELNVYSDDTHQDYTITKEAMSDPTSATQTAGVSTTKWTRVDPSELPDTLYCIRECLTASNLNAHYADVKTQADPLGDASYTASVVNPSPTPYADVGPYIKSTQTVTRTYDAGTEYEWSESVTYTRGDWQDGIVASDVYTYTSPSDIFTDKAGSALTVGVDWGVSRPGDLIRGARFANPDGWTRETEWGINTGMLITQDNLQYIECDYTLDSSNNKVYTDYHPEYTSANGKLTETRYCVNKLWGNDNILTSYNVNVRLEKQYDIYNSDGTKVALDPPKTLYYRVPNDAAKYGKDADKKFRLDYHGDHLGGIPGSVIDINTGQDLGEYVTEWKDGYRWVQRWVIPDGSILTDGNNTEYLVKALAGEEWLGKKDSAIGTLSSLLTTKTASDLLTNLDVDFEISQRVDNWYDCNLTYERTETYTDSDGNTQTETFTETDWDACHALEPDTDEYNAAWTLTNTFANCNEKLQYWIDERNAQIAQDKANQEANGGTYDGPANYTEDENFMSWFSREQDRCKAIGPLPTEIINGGNASVVNGTIVYDPTP